jgi:hypothetical protein
VAWLKRLFGVQLLPVLRDRLAHGYGTADYPAREGGVVRIRPVGFFDLVYPRGWSSGCEGSVKGSIPVSCFFPMLFVICYLFQRIEHRRLGLERSDFLL